MNIMVGRLAMYVAVGLSIAAIGPSCTAANRLEVNQLTPDEASCYAQALTAGSSSGYWQPGTIGAAMYQGETKRNVYLACLRSKGDPAPEKTLAVRNHF